MNGVILLDKPAGKTSHDCVFLVRKLLKTKKVGHTGTLDPSVTGVLPICVGRATKLSQFLTADEKEYLGEVTLGFSTTTEDADGETVETKLVQEEITKERVLEVMKQLTGTITQTPPMYSAVKVNGRKLYEYARAGETVERPTRTIQIRELELLSDPVKTAENTVKFAFRVKGSKGLYVRTLAVMIGEALGYPAHMSHLRRTQSGIFKIEDCQTLETLEEAVKAQAVCMLSVEQALGGMPSVTVDARLEGFVRNGVKLYDHQIKGQVDGPFVILNEAGHCLAIYEKEEQTNQYKSVRGLL